MQPPLLRLLFHDPPPPPMRTSYLELRGASRCFSRTAHKSHHCRAGHRHHLGAREDNAEDKWTCEHSASSPAPYLFTQAAVVSKDSVCTPHHPNAQSRPETAAWQTEDETCLPGAAVNDVCLLATKTGTAAAAAENRKYCVSLSRTEGGGRGGGGV